MTDLGLWLDNYTDIYSDFDSRNYSKRRISDDFLYELKAALHNREEKNSPLVLYVPEEKRNAGDELAIAESLKYYFTHELYYHVEHYRKKLRRGILFFLTGVVIIAANILTLFYLKNSFLPTALKLLLEPAGWYFLWSALEFLFKDLREAKQERAYYRGLSEIRIEFRSSNQHSALSTAAKAIPMYNPAH